MRRGRGLKHLLPGERPNMGRKDEIITDFLVFWGMGKMQKRHSWMRDEVEEPFLGHFKVIALSEHMGGYRIAMKMKNYKGPN